MSDFTVQVKDFQSISKADLVIEDGLTIITGKTNAGKTALIRAIDSAIFNVGNDDMVKAGKRYAGVMVDNGVNKFIWRRDSQGKNEKTLYQINQDKPITKVGRTQLEEITKLFNITDVRLANSVREKINFWYQGKAPFLTDRTEGQLFEFFSQSSCDRFIKIIKKMEMDMRSQKATIDNLNASVDVLRTINQEKKRYLDKNDGFNNFYGQIIILNRDIGEFSSIEDMVSRITSMQARVGMKIKDLNKITDMINGIGFKNIQNEYDNIILLHDTSTYIKEALTNLKYKRDTKNSKNIELHFIKDKLKIKQEGFDKLRDEVNETQNINDDVFELRGVLESLKTKGSKREIKKDELSRIKSMIGRINLETLKKGIDDIDGEATKIEEINTLVKQYENRLEKKTNKESEYKIIVDNLVSVEGEFTKFKDTIGYCPYCSNSLEVECKN